MLNVHSLELAMASHHVMVLRNLLNIMLQNIVYKGKILSYQSMLDLCAREFPSITFFGVSQEEVVNVRADLEDCFAKSRTLPGTRSSHHFVPISCNKFAPKLTSEDREFFQFDFNKSLTEEIQKSINCFSYVSYIYDTFWWVGIVTEVNVHEGDLKIYALSQLQQQ